MNGHPTFGEPTLPGLCDPTLGDDETVTEDGAPGFMRLVPVRKAATSSMGFCVAERPMRCGAVVRPVSIAPGLRWFSPQTSASRRSRVRAKWAPRLSSAMAWISSTMTVWTR